MPEKKRAFCRLPESSLVDLKLQAQTTDTLLRELRKCITDSGQTTLKTQDSLNGAFHSNNNVMQMLDLL